MSSPVAPTPERTFVPFKARKLDQLAVIFFASTLVLFYFFEVEQVILSEVGIVKPSKFTYPVWPPSFCVDAVHALGRSISPVLIARPVWWLALVWVQLLVIGPVYAVAIFAFVEAKEWIREPLLIASALHVLTGFVKAVEEGYGAFPAKNQDIAAYINILLIGGPAAIIYYLLTVEHPFTKRIVLASRRAVNKKEK